MISDKERGTSFRDISLLSPLFGCAWMFFMNQERKRSTMTDSYPQNPVRAVELQPNRLLFIQNAHDPLSGWRFSIEITDQGSLKFLFRHAGGGTRTLFTADPSAESIDARLQRLEQQVASLLSPT
jgi:hypothetical protein